MAKKSKRNEFDIDPIEQQNMLESINDAISSGDITQIENADESSAFDDNFTSFIDELLSEKINDNATATITSDTSIPVTAMNDEKRLLFEQAEDKFDNETLPKDKCNELKITYKVSANKVIVLTITDGITTLTVDPATLRPSTIRDMPDCTSMSYHAIAKLALMSSIHIFYPSTIIADSAALSDKLLTVHDLDYDKFVMFNHPIGHFKLAYYISEESMNNYMEFIDAILLADKFEDFLVLLSMHISDDVPTGINFSGLPHEYISQIMLLPRYKNSVERYADLVWNDEGTSFDRYISTNTLDNIFGVTSILDTPTTIASLIDLITLDDDEDEDDEDIESITPANIVDDDEDEDDDEDDEDDDEDMSTITFNTAPAPIDKSVMEADKAGSGIVIKSDSSDNDEIPMVTFNSAPINKSKIDSIVDEDEDDDEFSDLIEDDEEVEKEYFGDVKETKQVIKPMKISDDSDDDMFVVKRKN